MTDQVLHYSEIQDEPEVEKVVDLDSLYSNTTSGFEEEFLEKSISKEIEILEEQIENCRKEITERQKIHEDQRKELKERIHEYRSALTNSQKLNKISKGDSFHEKRANIIDKIGEMEERIREEERENWQDKQDLRNNIRELEKEVQELKKRKQFMKFYSRKL